MTEANTPRKTVRPDGAKQICVWLKPDAAAALETIKARGQGTTEIVNRLIIEASGNASDIAATLAGGTGTP